MRIAQYHATESQAGRQDTDQYIHFVVDQRLGSFVATASTTYFTAFFLSVKLASAPLADAGLKN